MNGSAGLDLPHNSFIELNMDSYWMSASRFKRSQGGKHGIPRAYLQLQQGEYRLVIMLRVVREKNVVEAMNHFHNCHNKDHRCWCLNKQMVDDEIDILDCSIDG